MEVNSKSVKMADVQGAEISVEGIIEQDVVNRKIHRQLAGLVSILDRS